MRPGDVVAGKFRIERVLGQGGMGVVVAAQHLQLDEMVALKFLRAHASTDPEMLGRFTREARAAAKLKSEHVARVLDVGVADDGTPYIVMEYLEGRDLGRVVHESGRLDVATATEYAIQACEGLAEAHARGIVHRDIKPDNLFLVERSEGWRVIKILDFGISKLAVARGALETSNISTGSLMGSPCYMSPEQLRSTATVDHRTDIWSLGVTLFELLAGRTAYAIGQTLPQLITSILEQPTPHLIDVRPDIPLELAAVVARSMAKDRDDRYANAGELAVALLPFAPKRARAAAERAVSITQSSGLSSRSPIEIGTVTLPPPGAKVPSGTTLRAASWPRLPLPHDNRDTLAAPTVTASRKIDRRTASWVAFAFAVLAGALTVTWTLRHAPPTAVVGVGASSIGAVVAPPVGSSPAVPVVAADLLAIGPPSPPVAAQVSSAAAPTNAVTPLPSRRPSVPRGPPAARPPASPPPSGSPSSLDIRMQR